MEHLMDLKSRNGDMFVYSAYWHTWSRVLSPMDALDIGQVEVDLTALGVYGGAWRRVERVNIRVHHTPPESANKVVYELPAEVVQLMKKWIPNSETLDRLLHEDLLPQIDWDKYRKLNNGGAPFNLITKD